MTLSELQQQVLTLSIAERWQLVQIMLNSIQQETAPTHPSASAIEDWVALDPWTQSLIGIIQLDVDNPTEQYIDYLGEKYL
jgi:hypothetical protein